MWPDSFDEINSTRRRTENDSGNFRRPPGDNVAMDTGEQVAAEIIDAIRSGRDVWVFDQILQGPNRLEHARKLLLERRAACSDPDEVAFLTNIIGGLEQSAR
jgi:hypothetical protein